MWSCRFEVVINSIGSHKYNGWKSRDCWTMIMESSVYNFWPPTGRQSAMWWFKMVHWYSSCRIWSGKNCIQSLKSEFVFESLVWSSKWYSDINNIQFLLERTSNSMTITFFFGWDSSIIVSQSQLPFWLRLLSGVGSMVAVV